jgi:hypothetical protein
MTQQLTEHIYMFTLEYDEHRKMCGYMISMIFRVNNGSKPVDVINQYLTLEEIKPEVSRLFVYLFLSLSSLYSLESQRRRRSRFTDERRACRSLAVIVARSS